MYLNTETKKGDWHRPLDLVSWLDCWANMARSLCIFLCALAHAAGIGDGRPCLLYGTITGMTEDVAVYISELTGLEAIPIGSLFPEDFNRCDHYIVGSPTTTGLITNPSGGEGSTGTDWDLFLTLIIKRMDSLFGKKVAVFGLGNQQEYPMGFVDAMDELARAFIERGAELIGHTSVKGYHFQNSLAVWPELGGQFCGLPIDENTEPELTAERIRKWLDQLREEGMPVPIADPRDDDCEKQVRKPSRYWGTEPGERIRGRALCSGHATSTWTRRFSCWLPSVPELLPWGVQKWQDLGRDASQQPHSTLQQQKQTLSAMPPKATPSKYGAVLVGVASGSAVVGLIALCWGAAWRSGLSLRRARPARTIARV